MKHQLKEDIRDQYIYGILKDSGERIMPTLDELIKKHKVPSSTLYRISSKEEWKLQRKQFQNKLRQELDESKNNELKEKLFKCEEASIDIAYKIFNEALKMINTVNKITPNGLASISSAAYTAQKIYTGKSFEQVNVQNSESFQKTLELLDNIAELKKNYHVN
tara:strand:- start:2283 stop:2771 length:489 start_codon:yes stop_codon:yes gene_type:complete